MILLLVYIGFDLKFIEACFKIFKKQGITIGGSLFSITALPCPDAKTCPCFKHIDFVSNLNPFLWDIINRKWLMITLLLTTFDGKKTQFRLWFIYLVLALERTAEQILSPPSGKLWVWVYSLLFLSLNNPEKRLKVFLTTLLYWHTHICFEPAG